MTADLTTDRAEVNRQRLGAELNRVRRLLERHAARSAGPPEPAGRADPGARDAPEAAGACETLDLLAGQFDLTPFERDVLVLCAGVELDAGFAEACAAAQGGGPRCVPTFGLALAALPGGHWSALAPPAPLRHWRLVEPEDSATLVTSRLRIDERILHFLLGVNALDARLHGLARVVSPGPDLPESRRAQVDRLRAIWERTSGPLPVVRLVGNDRAAARMVAVQACEPLGLQAIAVRLSDIPASPAERSGIARLLVRECALRTAALVVDCGESGQVPEWAEDELPCPVILLGANLAEPGPRSAILELRSASPDERLASWRDALGAGPGPGDAELERVSYHFCLSPDSIAGAARDARDAVAQGAAPAEALWHACRVRSRDGLDALAQRIEPRLGWDDLVLPAAQVQLLHDVARQVRQRGTVYDRWGFAEKCERGLGISALFTGESGTGKTLAAEVLAGELRLDLYRIDLSAVVSKYIGETEKNLKRVFDAADSGGAVLLFDEADALFGRRSEVKDSHDRYANIELAYLLQRMETYRGLAILTTNVKALLDPAFLRRIRFIVAFPFPDAGRRAQIWQRMFPPRVPLGTIRIDQLARLNVAGGTIRNIALNAAFFAADEGLPLSMPHLLRAARVEYAKLEKPLTDAEIGGWL